MSIVLDDNHNITVLLSDVLEYYHYLTMALLKISNTVIHHIPLIEEVVTFDSFSVRFLFSKPLERCFDPNFFSYQTLNVGVLTGAFPLFIFYIVFQWQRLNSVSSFSTSILSDTSWVPYKYRRITDVILVINVISLRTFSPFQRTTKTKVKTGDLRTKGYKGWNCLVYFYVI